MNGFGLWWYWQLMVWPDMHLYLSDRNRKPKKETKKWIIEKPQKPRKARKMAKKEYMQGRYQHSCCSFSWPYVSRWPTQHVIYTESWWSARKSKKITITDHWCSPFPFLTMIAITCPIETFCLAFKAWRSHKKKSLWYFNWIWVLFRQNQFPGLDL